MAGIVKRFLLVIIEILILAVCGFFSFRLQSYLSVHMINREIDLTLKDSERILSSTMNHIEKNYSSYESVHQAMTKMAVYYLVNDKYTGFATNSMSKLKYLLNVTNVILTDLDGNIITSAGPCIFDDFKGEDFKALRELEGTGKISEGLLFVDDEVKEGEQKYFAFYAAVVDRSHMIIIEDDWENIIKIVDKTSSWKSALSLVSFGKTGFVFSVGSNGEVRGFNDQDNNEIKDLKELGISYEDIKDGYRGNYILNGMNYYCGVEYYDAEDSFLICAIENDEIVSYVTIIAGIMMFIVFVLLSIMLIYYSMLIRESREGEFKSRPRVFLLKKLSVLFILSATVIILSSVYCQTLYTTLVQARSNKAGAEILVNAIGMNEGVLKEAKDDYDNYLKNLTSIAAKFVSDNPKLVSKKELSDIAANLGAKHILLYDTNGTVTVSDSYYKGLRLSSDPEDLSYQFRKLLTGTRELLQDETDAEYLDEPYRFSGAIVTTLGDDLNGFIQLAFPPDYLSASTIQASAYSFFSNYSGSNNAFAFLTDNENGTLLYYPNESFIGTKYETLGITPEINIDSHISITDLGGDPHILYCKDRGIRSIFTASPLGDIQMQSISSGIYLSLAGVLSELVFYFVLMLVGYAGEKPGKDSENLPHEDEFRNEQPVYAKESAEDRVGKFLKGAFIVFSGCIFISDIFKELIFNENEFYLNILSGKWNRAVHIFSISACIKYICIVCFIMTVVVYILELAGSLMHSGGETIARMLLSFCRYIAVIGTGFYCAKLLGVQTDALLASAGILTVLIGLGTQSLMTDILAGLFIVFEMSFKVGDLIKVDNWRGKVLEIGIRNTKIWDIDDNDIKIIHNSSLQNFINLSELNSFCYATIAAEYGDDLKELEEIIEKELPDIHKRIPKAIEGPVYLGVSELADSAVILKFKAACRNEDILPVKRAMNRELKLLFDRNGINVPFPQVVINNREESGENRPGKDMEKKEYE